MPKILNKAQRSYAALPLANVAGLSRAWVMMREWPRRLQLLCGGVLTAILALSIDAMRLGRGAVSSNGAMVAGLAATASVPLAADSAAARVQRDRDLRTAANHIDSIHIDDYFLLGDIKNILESFENIRERVLSFGSARDAHHRLQIRNILRNLRERGDALKVRARALEAEGHLDDGGDELPSQRDNICSRISKDRVEEGFFELVLLFCECLDDVRKAVNAGIDEEPMAYSVSGLLKTMTAKPDYQRGHIGREIEGVLGEERRWLARHLAPRPAGAGDALHSPEGTRTGFRRWALRAWETQMWADIGVDTAARPLKALKKANDALVTGMVEDDLLLSSVRIRISRLEFRKFELAQFISSSDPKLRERIRDVLQEIKVRMDALRALAARKVAAGEVDNSGELLPSQRDNICTKLEASGLEEDFRDDIRKICETFDRLHVVVNVEHEKNKCAFELSGRMAAIRRRPGYSDLPVASELDDLFMEEWTWLDKQKAVARR